MKGHSTSDISAAEARVMGLLWQTAPQSSEELAAALHGATGWHHNTVRTLLNRLRSKGAIRATREGRRYLYAPLLSRDAWQSRESHRFIDTVFGGKVGSLLVHFSRHEQLGGDDVAELRKLVERLEAAEKGHD